MYEIPIKKETQIIVLMSRPYKEALKRLAARTGSGLSHLVRQSIAEYVDTHHEGAFNQIYDECIQDFKTRSKK